MQHIFKDQGTGEANSKKLKELIDNANEGDTIVIQSPKIALSETLHVKNGITLNMGNNGDDDSDDQETDPGIITDPCEKENKR